MYEQRIESAADLIASDPKAAEATLEQVLSEIAAERQPNSLGDCAADAEEFLAEIALKAGRWDDTIIHAQRAVVSAQRFRAKAQFLAADALANLGEIDMAISKLEMVVSWSQHKTLTDAAVRKIESLRSDGKRRP